MNTYLHFKSHHPRHLKANIPYWQFLRIKQNATDPSEFRSFSQKLYHQFLRRGYLDGIVASAIKRAALRDREDLFQDKRKEDRTCDI